MKSKILAGCVIACFASTAVSAASVTVIVDGVPTEYTLSGLTVNQAGGVEVRVVSGAAAPQPTAFQLSVSKAGTGQGVVKVGGGAVGAAMSYPSGTSITLTAESVDGSAFAGWEGACSGTSSCLLTMNANQSVVARFNLIGSGSDPGGGSGPVDNGACVPSDVLKCVVTTASASWWASGAVRPAPTEVQAYSFKTPAGTAIYSGSATATRTTGAVGKLVVISKVAGDVSTTGKDAGCYAISPETSAVSYVTNYAGASSNRFCKLTPGTTYYANVAPVAGADGKPTCTTATQCGYTFELR